MENQNQKWVNLSFLAFAGGLAWVLFTLLTTIAAGYDLEARVKNVDMLIRGLSLGVGALLFFVLYRSQKSSDYMSEVVVELSRVTWPTPKDTYRATIVVVLMVLIFGFLLGGLDTFWVWLLRFVL